MANIWHHAKQIFIYMYKIINRKNNNKQGPGKTSLGLYSTQKAEVR